MELLMCGLLNANVAEVYLDFFSHRGQKVGESHGKQINLLKDWV